MVFLDYHGLVGLLLFVLPRLSPIRPDAAFSRSARRSLFSLLHRAPALLLTLLLPHVEKILDFMLFMLLLYSFCYFDDIIL